MKDIYGKTETGKKESEAIQYAKYSLNIAVNENDKDQIGSFGDKTRCILN